MVLIRNSDKKTVKLVVLIFLALRDFVRIYKKSEETEKTKFKLDIPSSENSFMVYNNAEHYNVVTSIQGNCICSQTFCTLSAHVEIRRHQGIEGTNFTLTTS